MPIELAVASLPEGRPIRLEDGDEGLVVLRVGDVVRAWRDVCPHAGWRLSDGALVDGALECPGHGWRFDPATGTCIDVCAYALDAVPVVATAGVVVVGP